MRKMKKGMVVALTATMVLGSTLTAFASDAGTTTPVTSGSTSGAGTSEGHVDKEVVNMVLPTIASGSSPFAYTMDPERLIQETNGAKYEDFTFPAKESDKGVYFLTGDKTHLYLGGNNVAPESAYDDTANAGMEFGKTSFYNSAG